MKETCRAKAEWRCVEPPYPSEPSTFTSPPCVHHPEISLNTNAYGFLFRLQIKGILIDLWPLVIDWVSVSSPLPRNAVMGLGENSNLQMHVRLALVISAVLELSSVAVHGSSHDLWKTVNSKRFKRPGSWITQGSNIYLFISLQWGSKTLHWPGIVSGRWSLIWYFTWIYILLIIIFIFFPRWEWWNVLGVKTAQFPRRNPERAGSTHPTHASPPFPWTLLISLQYVEEKWAQIYHGHGSC